MGSPRVESSKTLARLLLSVSNANSRGFLMLLQVSGPESHALGSYRVFCQFGRVSTTGGWGGIYIYIPIESLETYDTLYDC